MHRSQAGRILRALVGGLFGLAIPSVAESNEILTVNVTLYVVEPTISNELRQGVLFSQTFNQLRDEIDFLRVRYNVKRTEVLAIQPVRFSEPGVFSGSTEYRGSRLRLIVAWHDTKNDLFLMELGVTYDERTLLQVPSFGVPNRGTFAVGGETEAIGSEAYLDEGGLLRRRAANKQVLATVTPVWRTQGTTEATGTLNSDPTVVHADLHITRERYYGDAAVGLETFELFRDTRKPETIRLGAVSHVQSILVEAFDGQPTVKIFRGRIRFSPNAQVLGIATDLDSLSPAQPVLHTTEKLFSTEKRQPGARLLRGGLETNAPGSTAWDDFVTVEGNTVYFQLGITMGADDFRILLQYEMSALTSASFDVELDDTFVRGVQTSGGLIVGGEHLGDDYLFTEIRVSGPP
jgi:hypothetical protein